MSNSERQSMYELESDLRRWWHRVTGAIVLMTSSATAWIAFRWLVAH